MTEVAHDDIRMAFAHYPQIGEGKDPGASNMDGFLAATGVGTAAAPADEVPGLNLDEVVGGMALWDIRHNYSPEGEATLSPAEF